MIFTMMTETVIRLKDGAQIVATCHDHPDATTTAIILHGFYSSRQSGNVIAALDSFAAMGLSAIAPDLYGRGDSDGAFGDLTLAKGVDTVSAIIKQIKQRDSTQTIVLTGGSFGGLIALHAAAQLPDIALLILRAPVSNWRAVWRDWVTPDEMAAWDQTGVHHGHLPDGRAVTFGRAFYDEIMRDNIYTDVAPSLTVPTLIVHGTADETVPLAQSEMLHSVIADSTTITIPGADHQFKNPEHLKIYQTILQDFIAARFK